MGSTNNETKGLQIQTCQQSEMFLNIYSPFLYFMLIFLVMINFPRRRLPSRGTMRLKIALITSQLSIQWRAEMMNYRRVISQICNSPTNSADKKIMTNVQLKHAEIKT